MELLMMAGAVITKHTQYLLITILKPKTSTMTENTRGHNADGHRGSGRKQNASANQQRHDLGNERQVFRGRDGHGRGEPAGRGATGRSRMAFDRDIFSPEFDGQLSDE